VDEAAKVVADGGESSRPVGRESYFRGHSGLDFLVYLKTPVLKAMLHVLAGEPEGDLGTFFQRDLIGLEREFVSDDLNHPSLIGRTAMAGR
jgi:hypothetical protein